MTIMLSPYKISKLWMDYLYLSNITFLQKNNMICVAREYINLIFPRTGANAWIEINNFTCYFNTFTGTYFNNFPI